VIRWLAALAFANAAVWALITPIFDAPDEYDHYAYSEYLAQTGHAPCQACKRPPWSTDERLAIATLHVVSYIEGSDGRPPWLAASIPDGPQNDGGGPTTAATHSPVYYALTLPAYAAAHSDSVASRVTAMRLVSAALGALTVISILLAAWEIFSVRYRMFAVFAALLAAFQPMFSFGSGSLNNDAGVNLVAASLLYVMVRGLRTYLTTGLAVASGILLALAPLMKGTGYELYPAVLLAVVVMLVRRHESRDLRAVGFGLATFALVQIAWSLVAGHFERASFTTPGGVVPGSSGPVADALRHPFGFASYFWQVFLPKLPFMTDLHPQPWPAFDIYVKRGWAAFGWYAIEFPNWIYVVIAGIMVTVGLFALRSLWRLRASLRPHLPVILVVALVISSVIGAVEASFYTPTGGRAVVAEQGRYAFTAIGAFAIVTASSCFAFGRRYAPWIASTLMTLVVALNLASVLVALRGFYM